MSVKVSQLSDEDIASRLTDVSTGYKRAVAFAMSTAVGNCGALISSNVFITSEAPTYQTGFAVGMGINGLSILSLTAL